MESNSNQNEFFNQAMYDGTFDMSFDAQDTSNDFSQNFTQDGPGMNADLAYLLANNPNFRLPTGYTPNGMTFDGRMWANDGLPQQFQMDSDNNGFPFPPSLGQIDPSMTSNPQPETATAAENPAQQSTKSSKPSRKRTITDVTAPAPDAAAPPVKKRRARKPKKQPSKEEEERKRNKFLERNRIAASKCRNRKKEWSTNLEENYKILGIENDAYKREINNLHEQIAQLKSLIHEHVDCHHEAIAKWFASEADRIARSPEEAIPHMRMSTDQDMFSPISSRDSVGDNSNGYSGSRSNSMSTKTDSMHSPSSRTASRELSQEPSADNIFSPPGSNQLSEASLSSDDYPKRDSGVSDMDTPPKTKSASPVLKHEPLKRQQQMMANPRLPTFALPQD
jgi:hypothetical protein